MDVDQLYSAVPNIKHVDDSRDAADYWFELVRDNKELREEEGLDTESDVYDYVEYHREMWLSDVYQYMRDMEDDHGDYLYNRMKEEG